MIYVLSVLIVLFDYKLTMQEVNLTQQEQEEVCSKFKKRKKLQYMLVIPFAIWILPLIITRRWGTIPFWLSEDIVMPISVVILIVGLILSWINWRCPYCNKYLGKQINPAFCQKCGVKLR